MKKLTLLFLAITSLTITSCSSNEDESGKSTSITINFTHNWEGKTITSSLIPETDLVNLKGDKLSIERLRYLVSNIYLENSSGIATEITDYIFVDASDEETLTFSTENLLLNGTYELYFTFGLPDEDNVVEDGRYLDLNTANFDVPSLVPGGGYHYMQLDGNFIDSSNMKKGYNYHVISAYNTETALREDTSFEVNLGEIEIIDNATTINVEMDINEWFKDTNTWDLNIYNQMLMINYEAQKMMNENGQTVFSLTEEEEEEENL